MATEVYRHPDMLNRGTIYKVYFRGHSKPRNKNEGSIITELVATGIFKKMMVAVDDAPDGTGTIEANPKCKKVLAVLFRSPREEYDRVISWYRITQLEEVTEEEAYL